MKNSLKTWKTISFVLFTSLSLLTLSSCNKNGCTDATATNFDSEAHKDDGSCLYGQIDDFERQEMLNNMVTNYILPAYSNYHSITEELVNKVNIFTDSPSINSLQELKTTWKDATLIWQDVSFLDFGPSTSISLATQTNIYPINIDLINLNISSGNYNLQLPFNYDAKGLQALDYLLFGISGDSEQSIVDYYSTHPLAKTYLIDLANELETNAETVHNSWASSYSQTFTQNSTDNSQGSAVSTMINGMTAFYEVHIRKGKIGIPAGAFNGFSQSPMPESVEAFYSGYSLEFALRATESLKKFIFGNNYQTNEEGLGLDNYIAFVDASTLNNESLENAINDQFDDISTALNSHTETLSFEVINNSTEVLATYEKFQQLVPLLKVDLTSALGVLVTYQDNDGD